MTAPARISRQPRVEEGRRASIFSEVEWPTWIVAAGVYCGWIGLIMAYEALPLLVFLPLAALVVALQTSLQHETIHGHPTRSDLINTLVGYAPLSIFLPYERYKALHLQHHEAPLTDPLYDPETHYVRPGLWRKSSWLMQRLYRVNATLLGHLTIGPLIWIPQLYRSELRMILGDGSGSRRWERAKVWILHLVAVTLLLGFVWSVGGINPVLYVFGVAYPAHCVIALRGFAEHRPADIQEHRTAIIHTNPLLRLLFLNNTYHAVHHMLPGQPWYKMPTLYWQNRGFFDRSTGGFVIDGYREVFKQAAITPYYGAPFHPDQGPRTTENRTPEPRPGADSNKVESPSAIRPFG